VPPSLRYGFLLGLAQTLATLIVCVIGLHAAGETLPRAQFVENLVGFVFMIIVVALGMRAARKARDARGEESTFGAGALSALAIAFFGALFAGLGQAAYMAFVNPGFQQVLREAILAGATEQLAALSPEDAAEATRTLDLMVSPLARGIAQGVSTFLFATIVGLAFAVVLRAALRREAADRAKVAASPGEPGGQK
jgi:hypothetical protein